MRAGNIDLLNSLFGFGGKGTGAGPGANLENLFGSLAPAGIQQFLSQPTPESRALNTSLPALQEILTPGTMNPQFDQDLSLANQQGGRFGSANAILRGEAFKNLFNARTQAAQTLGMLGSQAGQGDARTAGLMDLETQRRLQILMHLLGVSQGASFNVPNVQQASPLDSASQIAAIIASIAGAAHGAKPAGFAG